MLPNFLVIGARRSGTTWIHLNLSEHPEVFMPKHVKEVHFFDRHYEKGIDFYESHFREATTEKAIGEATPAYLDYPEVCPRIQQHLPDARLIVTLRNPVDQLYSRFIKASGKGKRRGDISGFDEFVRSNSSMHERGFFIDHLKRYSRSFSRNQMLVVFFDILDESPKDYYRQILTFLEVDPRFTPSFIKEKINASASKKYVAKSRVLYYLSVILQKIRLWKVAIEVEKRNRAPIPEMKTVTRQWLIDTFYGSKNIELGDFLGVDLSHWNNP
jgi:hypothetical protein